MKDLKEIKETFRPLGRALADVYLGAAVFFSMWFLISGSTAEATQATLVYQTIYFFSVKLSLELKKRDEQSSPPTEAGDNT